MHISIYIALIFNKFNGSIIGKSRARNGIWTRKSNWRITKET